MHIVSLPHFIEKRCSTPDSIVLPLIRFSVGAVSLWHKRAPGRNADSTVSLLLNNLQLPEIKQSSVLENYTSFIRGKYRVRETLNLSTCADIRTDTKMDRKAHFLFSSFSPVMCHVSHFVYHLSHVTCRVSQVTNITATDPHPVTESLFCVFKWKKVNRQ